MLQVLSAFSGFSVKSSTEARAFYSDVLGLKVTTHGYGKRVYLPGDKYVFFYPKGAGHIPATYTILNLVVDDIDQAVGELKKHGVHLDPGGQYSDEQGIQRGIKSGYGHDQAWFKDPSGNIISLIQEEATAE